MFSIRLSEAKKIRKPDCGVGYKDKKHSLIAYATHYLTMTSFLWSFALVDDSAARVNYRAWKSKANNLFDLVQIY